MFIDSHCHLNFPGLKEGIDTILTDMSANNVSHALCVSVDIPGALQVIELADKYKNLYASVGIHPDYELDVEPTQTDIVHLAQHSKVIAIGETGLDYYRLTGNLEWQRNRFRTHIRAAIECGKPLIIHTRSAAEDTLRIMQEERAGVAGGVMHCFTESLEVAQAAIELGFYISFSGIVTFKSAATVKEVARQVPLDRILIETDAPYLAPIPYRGKTNQPAYVKYVAEEIAKLRNMDIEEVGSVTSANFRRLFLAANG